MFFLSLNHIMKITLIWRKHIRIFNFLILGLIYFRKFGKYFLKIRKIIVLPEIEELNF